MRLLSTVQATAGTAGLATERRPVATSALPLPPPPRRPLPPRLAPLQRLRRIIVIALLTCLVPIVVSFATTMAGPSNSSVTIRAFEWLRDHGAASIASQIESVYYTWNAPSTGGPALRKLPLAERGTNAVHPQNLTPLLHPALPGGGEVGPQRDLEWGQLSGPDRPVPQ